MKRSKRKYIITGASGKIGSYLMKKVGGKNAIGISKDIQKGLLTVDLADKKQLKKIEPELEGYDTLIHLAAKAHIDDCESDRSKGKKSEAWIDNVIATKNITEFCRKTGKKLIFISTECVFDGSKTKYTETDKPRPINWYGKTKLEAEKEAGKYKNAVILRTVMAYGGDKNYRDIVRSMAEMIKRGDAVKAVTDQYVSFTFIDDIADAVIKSADLTGLFHFAGRDSLSFYELGVKIADILGKNHKTIIPVTTEEILGRKKASLRPKNSILDSSNFKKITNYESLDINSGLKKAMKSWNLIK